MFVCQFQNLKNTLVDEYPENIEMPSIPDESKMSEEYFKKTKKSLQRFGCEQTAKQKEHIKNLEVKEVNKYLK